MGVGEWEREKRREGEGHYRGRRTLDNAGPGSFNTSGSGPRGLPLGYGLQTSRKYLAGQVLSP